MFNTIQTKDAKNTLRPMSLHYHDNAFFRLHFGYHAYGVFGATPVDMMHSFRKGIVHYVLDIFLINLLPVKKMY